MGKAVATAVLDGLLDKIATGTRISLCSAEPANFAGIAAVLLASKTINGAAFTKANGDVSGRKVTVAAQSAVPVTASGTGTHVVIDDGTTMLLATPTSASVAVTSGGTVDLGSFKDEVGAPT